MPKFGTLLEDARSRFERHSRGTGMVCATGYHMDCDVLKLRKSHWTNDDPTSIKSPTGGVFFSIWISDQSAAAGRAKYNIHSYRLRELRNYRITANDFCDSFRAAFKKHRKAWPNVSTESGCCTLMEGWFTLNPKTLARDTLGMMTRFEDVAAIIDDLLKRRAKA